MLFQKLLNDRLEKLGVLYVHRISLSKRCGLSRDTVTACLLDALDVLIVFLVWNRNHILKALKYHYRMYIMGKCNTLVERVFSLLNSRRDTQMESEDSPGLSFCFWTLFPVDISIDNCAVISDKNFYSFEIHTISQQIKSRYIMKDIATFAEDNLILWSSTL